MKLAINNEATNPTLATSLGVTPEREKELQSAMEAVEDNTDNYMDIIKAGVEASKTIEEAVYCSTLMGIAMGQSSLIETEK